MIKFLVYDSYLLGFLSKDRGIKRFAWRVCIIPDRLADRHLVTQRIGVIDPDGRLALAFVRKMERMNDDYELQSKVVA